MNKNEELIKLLIDIDNHNNENFAFDKLLEYSESNSDICHLAVKKINKQKKSDYYKKILRIITKFVEQNIETALVDMGVVYQLGILGENVNIEKAISYFQRAIENNNSGIACQSIGAIYYKGNKVDINYEKAYEYFMKGAEFQYADSEVALGIMYYDGVYVEKDYIKASYWFERGYESGRYDIAKFLGNIYNSENNILNDDEQALEWYCKGADFDSECAILAGGMYEKMGSSFYKESYEYYEKSSNMNNGLGCYLVGTALLDGIIVEKNTSLAKMYLKKSMQLGCAEAKSVLNTLNDGDGSAYNLGTFEDVGVNMKTTTFTGNDAIMAEYENRERVRKEENKEKLLAYAAATNSTGTVFESSGVFLDKDGNECYVGGDYIVGSNGDIYDYNKDTNYVYNYSTGKGTCLSKIGGTIYNWETGKSNYVSGSSTYSD